MIPGVGWYPLHLTCVGQVEKDDPVITWTVAWLPGLVTVSVWPVTSSCAWSAAMEMEGTSFGHGCTLTPGLQLTFPTPPTSNWSSRRHAIHVPVVKEYSRM